MFSDAATKTLFYGDYVEQFRVNVRISAFSVEFPLSSVENWYLRYHLRGRVVDGVVFSLNMSPKVTSNESIGEGLTW
nr:MAG TPA: hypothetical protein [Bacteriophage sp.]